MFPSVDKGQDNVTRLWEDMLDWDNPVYSAMCGTWERWCGELPSSVAILFPVVIFPKEVDGATKQLHGFCDVSKLAYAGVVYLRAVNAGTQIGTQIGTQKRGSKLALKTGTQTGAQNWCSKLALKTGPQNWPSKLVLKSGS